MGDLSISIGTISIGNRAVSPVDTQADASFGQRADARYSSNSEHASGRGQGQWFGNHWIGRSERGTHWSARSGWSGWKGLTGTQSGRSHGTGSGQRENEQKIARHIEGMGPAMSDVESDKLFELAGGEPLSDANMGALIGRFGDYMSDREREAVLELAGPDGLNDENMAAFIGKLGGYIDAQEASAMLELAGDAGFSNENVASFIDKVGGYMNPAEETALREISGRKELSAENREQLSDNFGSNPSDAEKKLLADLKPVESSNVPGAKDASAIEQPMMNIGLSFAFSAIMSSITSSWFD